MWEVSQATLGYFIFNQEQTTNKENRHRLIEAASLQGKGLGDWRGSEQWGGGIELKKNKKEKKLLDRDNSVVSAGAGKVKEGVGMDKWWWLDLGRWPHNTMCRQCVVEFCTWTLYNFNEYHSNTFNKNEGAGRASPVKPALLWGWNHPCSCGTVSWEQTLGSTLLSPL